MAPISPSSSLGKRSNPSHSDDDSFDEHPSKRQRMSQTVLPNTPPAEPEDEWEDLSVGVAPMFDDDPHQLLLRSVAVALEHVGFAGAQRQALEALCSEVNAYATHFLSKVTSSMLNSRRALPTPLDFQYALETFDLPISSVAPHLKPPMSPSKYAVQLEEVPVEEQTIPSANILLSAELSGEPDKSSKPYIPKHFPSFPSKHTYKWTEKEFTRETDPRKIREVASQTARQGEEALRRLTNVGKAGKEKDVKQAASKDAKSKERHAKWEQTMESFAASRLKSVVEDSKEQDDRSSLINANRQFYRKGVSTKRKLPPPPIFDQVP